MTAGGDGERELRRLAAELGFDHAAAIIVVCEGPDLLVRALNETMRAALQGRVVEGLPILEALPEVANDLAAERYLEVYETGTPYSARGWRSQLRTATGEVIEVFNDLWIVPWRDDDGTIRGVVATGMDSTARETSRRESVERERLAEGRRDVAEETVRVMQDTLLPPALPVVPGCDVAARYLLAMDHTQAGGDWFDAVVRPDGRLALVVGDVVGHGVVATAVMGRMRAVLQERLSDDVPLDQVMQRIDAYAASDPQSVATTVAVVVLDPDTGALEYCTAGHPQLLVVSSVDEPRFLPPSGAGPLGTGGPLTSATGVLGHDDVLVLYSDGLLERPGREMSQSLVELTTTATAALRGETLAKGAPTRAPDRVCELTLELMTRVSGYSDDITVLAAQTVPRTAPLHLEVAADIAAVPRVRHELADWLAAVGARHLDEVAVQHAVGEVVTNVVEHAYEGDPGRLVVDVGLRPDGIAQVEVVDHGRWREPSGDRGCGRGLALARQMVDTVVLDGSPHGTRVVMRHALTRSAGLLLGHEGGPADDGWDARTPFRTSETAGRLVVSGAVDVTAAELLRRQVRRAGGSGSRDLTIDLGGATLFGSAAVQVLFELRDEKLTLVAPAGSVAQQVLELVRLPYVTRLPGDA